MPVFIFYYLILPFLLAWLVLKFLRKYAKSTIAPDVTVMLGLDPVEKKFYRAVERDEQGKLRKLGDFEKHEDAVDRIYGARKQAQGQRRKGEFFVINDKGEALDLIESFSV